MLENIYIAIISVDILLCLSLSMVQERDTDVPIGWAAVTSNGIINVGTDIIMLTDNTINGQSYIAGTPGSATVYYWSVDQVTSTNTIQGKVWVFETSTGLPAVTVTSPASKTIIPPMTSDIAINVIRQVLKQ